MTTVSPSNELSSPDATGASLLRNAGTLFVGQLLAMVVPLLTVPYLARVLTPAGWGPVLAAQAFSNWLVLVLEFGFELSGTRAVARARSAPDGMSDVVHGVQSAKALLVVATLPVVVVVFLLFPSLHAYPALIGWGVAFAVLRGFSPLWFFQGIERVHGAVGIDTASRVAAAAGVFLLVHGPADGWLVIALQAVWAAVSLAVLTTWLAGSVPLRFPAAAIGIRTLREGSTIFACRAWSGLYIQANALVLSALAGAPVVAFFGGAERIIRAAINMLQPLTQVFLPRVSFLHRTDPAAARQTIRHALLGIGLLGLLMGLCALIGAPLLVRLLLGDGYGPAVAVLRVLATLPLLVAVNTVLGLYWALPFGHERTFLFSIVTAGITNVVLAVVLVPRWGALGMAAAASIAEVAVLVWLGALYLRRR